MSELDVRGAGSDRAGVAGVAGAVPAAAGEEAASRGAERARIVVIDYHKGNLSSVERGLVRAGCENVLVSDQPADIARAAGLVLPGVGSFFDAISFVHESGQDAAIIEAVGRGVPFLGICLGLQLLYERGDEDVPADADTKPARSMMGEGLVPGDLFVAPDAGGCQRHWVRGLGILAGSCTRLESGRLKVPHVGWDQAHVTVEGGGCPLLAGFAEGANVYFTHSYAVDADADPAQVAARTHYVRSFPCVAWRGNVYGCQFHPEKSSATGLAILRNFVSIVRSHSA
ncbi:glutamine amidotransferase-related protein [Olsenella uli]|uniref:glutamine amidotransferase-related protein n=1 Tax=Olsenella uli TaxID=133926 RepID=UPI0012ABE6DA|nr:imidazole glycerol phosphate synthase subunit HisH [Olsenella uli]